MDDLKDKRGYCQFKEEALDRTIWRNRFGRGSEPVVWQITDDDDDDDICEQAYRYYVLFFFVALWPNASQGLLIHEVSRSHTTTRHSW